MKSQKPKLKKFIATVEEDKMHDIKKIAAGMKKDGCVIGEVLEVTGIITGKVADIKLLDKYKKEGIASIEEDRKIKLS